MAFRPPHSRRAAVGILRRTLRRASVPGWLHDRGHEFFESVYRAAVEVLDTPEHKQKHRRLLGQAYYLAGDIHFLNSAYSQAIRCYRRSLRFHEVGEIHLDIGFCLTLVGTTDLLEAELEYAREAMHREGDYEMQGEIESLEDDLRVMRSIQVDAEGKRIDDPWSELRPEVALADALCDLRFDEATNLIRTTNATREEMDRCLIAGAQGDDERVLAGWQHIAQLDDAVKFDYLDWFYLPRSIINSPPLWQLLDSIQDRIQPGCSYGLAGSLFRTVYEIIPLKPDSRARRDGVPEHRFQQQLREECEDERRKLMKKLWIAYHRARTERDLPAAKLLAQRYPTWTGAQRLAERLASS